jgi:hypothetical protein
MKLQMFGSKSVKNKSDLKKVSIPTSSQPKDEDIWATGEQDALHIPILGSKAIQDESDDSYKPDLLNPFGVYVSDEAKNESMMMELIENDALPILEDETQDDSLALTEELTEEIDLCDVAIETIDSTSIPSALITETTHDEASELIIGLYAFSELYVKSLEKELAQNSNAKILSFNSQTDLAQRENLSDVNLWIVNLSDDDESEWLDSILELSAECPSLYLSGSLTKHCKQSIHTFLEEQ